MKPCKVESSQRSRNVQFESDTSLKKKFPGLGNPTWCQKVTNQESLEWTEETLKSVPSTLAEFHHNRIVQSPHENYFNVCQQHKEK